MYMHEYREYGSMYEAITTIGILVANDDLASQKNVAEVLRRCNYQVLHTGTSYDSLHAIWENKDRLDIVITNAQKLKSEGLAIIQNIEQKLKLKVLLIDNDERIEPKGELFSFSAYALNGLSVKCFDNLLENARRMEEDKLAAAENVERASISNAADGTNKASSSINDAERLNQKRKAAELYGERSEDSREDHLKPKKPRVTWTNEMHQKFLVAIERLGGSEKAVPKKIVEVMGVPSLSRENVASHLQTLNEKDLYHKPYCQILPLMSMPHNHSPFSSSSSLNSSFNKGSLILLQKYRCSTKSARNELEGQGDLTSPTASRLASFQRNLTAFPLSSYIHTFKESKLQYTSTSKDPSFGSLSGRRFYTTMGGASRLSDDRSGVDRLRNTTRCRNESISSSKFVGFRFKGNEIGYGPIKKINTDALFPTRGRSENQSTSYVQHHPISEQNLVGSAGCILQQSCLLGTPAGDCHQPVSRIHGTEETAAINTSQEPDLLSLYAPKLEEDTLQQISVQQSWETTANANASTTSSMFPPPHHQEDLSLPLLEATGNDFTEQSPAAFIDDILQQHCSPPLPQMFQDLDEIFNQSGNDDETLMNGIGNACDQFDFPELDDTFFSQDD